MNISLKFITTMKFIGPRLRYCRPGARLDKSEKTSILGSSLAKARG